MARAGEREGDKGAKEFCPSWSHHLTRLAIGPGTKATFCPGPKDSRDKWPGRKTYSVVMLVSQKFCIELINVSQEFCIELINVCLSYKTPTECLQAKQEIYMVVVRPRRGRTG